MTRASFRALERAKERIAQRGGASAKPESIVIKSAGRVDFVKVADIEWIEAADYYSRLHCRAKTYLLRRSIAELERELDAETFMRIHRSTIVRRERIARLEPNADGDYDALLADGFRLRVSRRYRKPVLSHLGVRKRTWC